LLLVVELGAGQMQIVAVLVVVALEDYLHRLHLYHLVRHTRLLSVLAELVFQMPTAAMAQIL
jgi:hypothetical protein